MKKIDKYLRRIQNQESIFPMDSLHSGKLPSDKVIYGNEDDEKDDNIKGNIKDDKM